LWPEHETTHLLANTPAEITSADLAPLALDLAAAGVADPLELQWLDPPAPAAFEQATELLRELDAIDERGTITTHGRELSALPVHPRLAHMLKHADSLGATSLACDIAALVSEREIFRGAGAPIDADIFFRLDVLRRDQSSALPPGAELDHETLRRVRLEADRLRRQLRVEGTGRASASESAGRAGGLLALAYPDRVAQRRVGRRARFLLRNGRGAELPSEQTLSTSAYIVAAELDDQRPESRISLAAAISLDEIREAFAAQIVVDDVVEFDAAVAAVVARRREQLGAIILRETSLANPDPELVLGALVGEVRRRGLASLPWSDAAQRLRQRIAFVGRHQSGWPNVGDDELGATLDEWLSPAIHGLTKWSDLERVDLVAALSTLIDWQQRRTLDELAPTHIDVPTGARLPVDYSDPAAPALAARIQELFGMADSPRLMRGTVTVTMQLLSPARRPVQVTQDLAGFWRSSYFDVRKDLRGRYPKHAWPDDPTTAVAKRR
jgi:ATP-dependent helicase HrpB